MLNVVEKSRNVKVFSSTIKDLQLKNLQSNLYETLTKVGLMFDTEVHEMFVS